MEDETWREGGETYNTGDTPDIGSRAPFCTEDDFGTTILPGLNVVGKMVIDPGSIAEISNLDGDPFGRVVITVARVLIRAAIYVGDGL